MCYHIGTQCYTDQRDQYLKYLYVDGGHPGDNQRLRTRETRGHQPVEYNKLICFLASLKVFCMRVILFAYDDDDGHGGRRQGHPPLIVFLSVEKGKPVSDRYAPGVPEGILRVSIFWPPRVPFIFHLKVGLRGLAVHVFPVRFVVLSLKTIIHLVLILFSVNRFIMISETFAVVESFITFGTFLPHINNMSPIHMS